MAFDPAIPANNSALNSTQIRSQFTALKQLIDDIPDGPNEAEMALLAQLLANVSFNGDNVCTVGNGFSSNNGIVYFGNFGEGEFVTVQQSDDGERMLSVSEPIRFPCFRTNVQHAILSTGPNTLVYVYAGYLHVSGPDDHFSISGFINAISGKQITVHNGMAEVGVQMTLKHNNPDEGSEFIRISCPAGVDLVCKQATLVYDDYVGRWVVVSFVN